jgi:peptidoglycan/LPS O-acetylase OafA/YrhL
MAALLAGVRSRPWLAGCFMVVGIGLSLVSISTSSRHGHLFFFWTGIAAIAGGLLIALGGETGYRRKRPGRREGA